MKIAILPGDGIGNEIIAEALKVFERLRRDGVPVETEIAPIGGAGYDAAKQPLPDATLRLAQSADAVVIGAVGGPHTTPCRAPCAPSRACSRSARRSGCSRTCVPRCSTQNLPACRRCDPKSWRGST